MLVLTVTINSTCCINRLPCSKLNSASCPCFHIHVPLLNWTKRNKLVFLKLFQWQCKLCALSSTQKRWVWSLATPRPTATCYLSCSTTKPKARWTAGLDVQSLNAHLPASFLCSTEREYITLVKGHASSFSWEILMLICNASRYLRVS